MPKRKAFAAPACKPKVVVVAEPIKPPEPEVEDEKPIEVTTTSKTSLLKKRKAFAAPAAKQPVAEVVPSPKPVEEEPAPVEEVKEEVFAKPTL